MHRSWIVGLLLCATLSIEAAGQQIVMVKADTETMHLAADWTNGIPPGSGYIGQFDGVISASNAAALSLGANITFDALSFAGSLKGPVALSDTNTLTLGAASGSSGILMGSANRDVTLDVPVELAGNHSWVIGFGRTLQMNRRLAGAYNLTKSGSGSAILGGGDANAPGMINQLAANGGTLSITGHFSTAGKFTASGGSVVWSGTGTNTGGYLGIGDGSAANLQVTAGRFENTPDLAMFISKGASNATIPVCSVEVSGGTLAMLASKPVYLGSGIDGRGGGYGILRVSSNGVFDTGTSAGRIMLGNNGGAGEIHLDGGTFYTLRSVTAGTNAANPGTSIFSFNGGTNHFTGDNASFMDGLTAAYVRNGGAIINDGGFTIGIDQSLWHSTNAADNATDGGLTKRGAGILILRGTNTYTGPTSVLRGNLCIDGRHDGTNRFTINGNATLSGRGVIGAPVSVWNDATVAPGPGGLTVGHLSMSGRSRLILALGSPTNPANARVTVKGNLTLAGSVFLEDTGGLATGAVYTAISYTGALVNNGLVSDTNSKWRVSVDTSVPNEVRLVVTQKVPVAQFDGGDREVFSTQTNLTGVLYQSGTGSIWYEVRDATGKMWDFGATPARTPWGITVRHLRPGTNTVTAFARDESGTTAQDSIRLVMNLGANPAIRPRPVPAEVWWGGLSTNYPMTNYHEWVYVQKHQDGYFFHSAGWGGGTALTSLKRSLATNLMAYNTRFAAELGASVANYGSDPNAWADQQLNQWRTWALGMEDDGIIWSELTHDYRMGQIKEMCRVNPLWPDNDLIAWWTGDMSIKTTNYPYTSGHWRDVFLGYYARMPHAKISHTSQPVYWYWEDYPFLANAYDNLAFTITNSAGTNSFHLNARDLVSSFINMAEEIGHPQFGLYTDTPWNYFGTWANQAGAANNREKIRVYERYLQSRGARHTLICNVSNAANQPGGDDAQDLYYETSSLNSMYLHQKEGGRANLYLFESWYHDIPHAVVPETKPGSYTHLAREAIRHLKGITTNDTWEPLTLSLLSSGSVASLIVSNGGSMVCRPAIMAFESGHANLMTRYSHGGLSVGTRMVSDEGFAFPDLIQPGGTATVLVEQISTGPLPAGAEKSITFEVFWNPQDPSGLVRDRVSGVWTTAATGTLQSAGALLIDLRATDAGAGSANWTNRGTLGGVFTRIGSPGLVSNVHATLIPGVQFSGSGQAYQGPNSVADIDGSGNRSIEVWAFNPSLSDEETMVSWGYRGSTRRNMAFNFGKHPQWGAVTHYGDDVSWSEGMPLSNRWWHLVYTYESSVAKVYVDGVLVNTKTLGDELDTYTNQPVNLACQRNTENGTRSFFLSGFLNSVRVHGGVLSSAQIALNHALGPWRLERPPVANPWVASVGASNGTISMVLEGDAGADYAVEASTNLIHWNPVWRGTPSLLPFMWTETNLPTAGSYRFYRMTAGP